MESQEKVSVETCSSTSEGGVSNGAGKLCLSSRVYLCVVHVGSSFFPFKQGD